MKHKTLFVNNNSQAAKMEKLMNDGWRVLHAFTAGNTVLVVLQNASR